MTEDGGDEEHGGEDDQADEDEEDEEEEAGEVAEEIVAEFREMIRRQSRSLGAEPGRAIGGREETRAMLRDLDDLKRLLDGGA